MRVYARNPDTFSNIHGCLELLQSLYWPMFTMRQQNFLVFYDSRSGVRRQSRLTGIIPACNHHKQALRLTHPAPDLTFLSNKKIAMAERIGFICRFGYEHTCQPLSWRNEHAI
jgi:hypothetical protein